MDFKELASKYKTPLYVYDFNYIKERYEALKNAFYARKSLVCYAVKANSNLSVLKFLADLGAGFDCVSIGEVKRALLAGAKRYQIIFSGVGKSDEELKEALENEILLINVESFAELLRLEEIAKRLNLKARISIRINPGVDAVTAKKMYIHAKASEFLEPTGIHFHIGSQLTSLSPIIDAAKIVSELLRELRALEIDIKFFDVGGGLGIIYNDEKEINLYDYAQGILGALKGQDVTIVCEPGRFIVGNAGYFIASVLYEKFNGKKRFVITDGAMNDLIRPSLYGAHHKIFVDGKDENLGTCDVVGPVCESGDFLAKDINLPECESGDVIVVKGAGAYGFSMSSNYNTRNRAAEVCVLDGKDRLIRRRESFEDVVAPEIEFLESADARAK